MQNLSKTFLVWVTPPPPNKRLRPFASLSEAAFRRAFKLNVRTTGWKRESLQAPQRDSATRRWVLYAQILIRL